MGLLTLFHVDFCDKIMIWSADFGCEAVLLFSNKIQEDIQLFYGVISAQLGRAQSGRVCELCRSAHTFFFKSIPVTQYMLLKTSVP